ncbi:hypothetical protein [Streptomyces sp. NPDC021212]|uniref:hypothetical protein n=1 Tax=Streptomyces sp. NPDC021212 TaxID=3365118 RepID=UPI003793E6E9
MGSVLDAYEEIDSDRLAQRIHAFHNAVTGVDTAVARDTSVRIRETIRGGCS